MSSAFNESCYLVVSMNENLFLDVETNNPIDVNLDMLIEAPRMVDKADSEYLSEQTLRSSETTMGVSSPRLLQDS